MEHKVYKNECVITWNKEWVGNFESPWSIFEKIKYANQATLNDLFNLFWKLQSNGHRAKNRGNYLRNLITLEGIDKYKTEKLLGFSIEQFNTKNIDLITNVFLYPKHSDNYLFRKELAYCKECLNIGFHSIFHQFKLLDYCPYHNKKLNLSCEKCNSNIPYLLNDNAYSDPFQCKCGHSFFNYKYDYSTIWKKVNELSIHDSTIIRWLDLNCKNSSKVYYHIENKYSNSNRILENIIYRLETNQMSNKLITKKNSTKNISNNLDITSEIDNSIFELFKVNFKSIVRYLKKTILLKHKTCIVRYKKISSDLDDCPYAFAFINWRKEIEGMLNYWNVENGNYKKRKVFQFFSEIDNKMLQDIYNLFIKQQNLDNNRNQLIRIILNLMVSQCLNHFYAWVVFSSKCALQKVKIYNPQIDYIQIEFMIVKCSINNWDNLILDQLSLTDYDIPTLNCPFNSKRLRRK
jgi:hypothetical protein